MVSCSSIEEPETEKPPHELAGTWRTRFSAVYIYFNIDKDGNFSFNSKDDNKGIGRHFNYSGKLADNFKYPYTIELVYNIYSSVLLGDMPQYKYDNTYKEVSPRQQIGKFTFIDASTCEAEFYMIDDWKYNGNYWNKLIYDNNPSSYGYSDYFRKQ